MGTTAIARLSKFPRFGTGIGLNRCEQLLSAHGIIPKSTVGITGTNGKGSTAAMVGALLSGAGVRTGVFTSPHFLDPSERFLIDGKQVAFDLFENVCGKVIDSAQEIEQATGETFSRFDLLTVIAWQIFEVESVEASVFEVGIGGRFDPTRLGQPRITAITSLDLEHTELLGGTLELIFCDKLELTPKGGVCFAALPSDEKLQAHCSTYARLSEISLKNIESIWPRLTYQEINGSPHMQATDENGDKLTAQLPLAGPWQTNNAGLAIACAQEALSQLNRPISVTRQAWVESSFCKVRVPGRFEKVSEKPTIIVDSAHTPDAIKQVVDHILSRGYGSGILLVGISDNKPIKQMAKQLSRLPFGVFVSSSIHGGANPEKIGHILQEQGMRIIGLNTDLTHVTSEAKKYAFEHNHTVYVLGGLFFAADVCRVLRQESLDRALYL